MSRASPCPHTAAQKHKQQESSANPHNDKLNFHLAYLARCYSSWPGPALRYPYARMPARRKSEVLMACYGYARVSTCDQNLNRQLDAFAASSIPLRRIYADQCTGASFRRPAYHRLMRRLRPGDVLVIKSIDRLGRNYAEILEQWRTLTQQRRVDIVVLDMPLLDTRGNGRGSGNESLTGRLIADIVLQLLSYVAQVERDNIRQRQAEGIAAAKSRGARFGRPRIARPAHYAEIKAQFERREITAARAGEKLGVCRATFEKWLRADRENEAVDAGESDAPLE